jgi:hypothetical protein
MRPGRVMVVMVESFVVSAADDEGILAQVRENNNY